jgi:molybdenum cofactor synthesis domain-containing protein
MTDLAAKLLSVSDSIAAGRRADAPGDALEEWLSARGFAIADRRVTPDGAQPVAAALRELCDGFAGLVVACGGCGLTPDDQTPEATRAVIEREAPGLAEAMRRAAPDGPLSRGVCGTRGQALILNTPGSPHGAVAWVAAIETLLGDAVRRAQGRK